MPEWQPLAPRALGVVKRVSFRGVQAVAQQPVAIPWEAAPSFKNYWGGIYRPNDCGRALNHAMVIVGYNAEASSPHWIVRNSWGKK